MDSEGSVYYLFAKGGDGEMKGLESDRIRTYLSRLLSTNNAKECTSPH